MGSRIKEEEKKEVYLCNNREFNSGQVDFERQSIGQTSKEAFHRPKNQKHVELDEYKH